jgi:H+/Cl- antiporter ClcA
MNQQTGKYIIAFGVTIVIVGLLVYFFHNKLNWFGRLPGDIRIERENFRFYFPIVTMLVLSILLTIIINILRRL